MTPQILLLLSIVVLAVLLFISEKVRPDVIALLVLLALGLTNLVTPSQAFSGLSSPSIILLLAVFMMTGGLFQTGVSQVIGRWLVRAAGESEWRMVGLVSLAAGGLSLFMNNMASGAVLLPAIMDVTRRTKIPPSRLLIPMAFATQLGGMATLFTTSNIVASGILHQAGFKPFGLFEFFTVGGPAALAGIVFLVLVGRRWLPDRRPLEEMAEQEKARMDVIELYQIQERLHEARINSDSSLIGKTLAKAEIGSQLGLTVLAIERDSRTIQLPEINEILRKNDVLLIAGREEKVCPLEAWGVTVRPAAHWPQISNSEEMKLLEVILAPHSNLVGQSLREMQFRGKYGLNVIAVWRSGRAYRTAFSDFSLTQSDVLLVSGPQQKFKMLQADPAWLVLHLNGGTEFRPQKMRIALLILAATLAAAAVGPWPIELVLFVGAIAMVLTQSLSMDEAYRAIDWRSIFLVGGMLPLGIALSTSGAAHLLGDSIIRVLGGLGPLAVIAGLFLATTLLNQFIPGGSAVPAVLTPIAIAAAQALGGDPRAYALVVAIATGTSFLTPFAHPVNVLVMGPGGYHFRDYFRAGFPLVVITFITVLLLLPVFWHIH